MSFVFISLSICIAVLFSVYRGMQEIEKSELKDIQKLKQAEFTKVKAKLLECSINGVYSYPKFIPNKILDVDDDAVANEMAIQWGEKQYRLRLKEEKAREQGGVYISMAYKDREGNVRVTSNISEIEPKVGYKNFARKISTFKNHYVYIDSSNNTAYMIEPSEKDIRQGYRIKANKDITIAGVIISIAIMIGWFFYR